MGKQLLNYNHEKDQVGFYSSYGPLHSWLHIWEDSYLIFDIATVYTDFNTRGKYYFNHFFSAAALFKYWFFFFMFVGGFCLSGSKEEQWEVLHNFKKYVSQ